MYETLIECHKILMKENLKAAPDKTYFMLKNVKFLGHIIEDKKEKPLTSRIDGFQKLEPPTSMKALQRYLGKIILRNTFTVCNQNYNHYIISYTKRTSSKGQKSINKFLNK